MMEANASFIDEEFKYIREKIDVLFKAAESLGEERQKVLDYKSAVANDINFVEWVLKMGLLPADPTAMRGREFFLHPVGQFSKEEFSSSMYEDETKEPRYLFVSNGCAICLLDLKLYRNRSVSYFDELRPLPKVATLKLIENDLPLSVGLFNFGLNAFMIGGQKRRTVLDTKDCNLKGTSRDTYRLDPAVDGTINPYLWHTEKLNSPKFWPIVEEVLGGDGHWRRIPTIGSPVNHLITSYLVVGPHIYAVAGAK